MNTFKTCNVLQTFKVYKGIWTGWGHQGYVCWGWGLEGVTVSLVMTRVSLFKNIHLGFYTLNPGFDPLSRHTKGRKNMVPVAPLLTLSIKR